MVFEWDEVKNNLNKRNHELSFEIARNVFSDPLALIREDVYQGEQRYQILGHVGGILCVVVVFTEVEREDHQVTRLISARRATKEERRKYEAGAWF